VEKWSDNIVVDLSDDIVLHLAYNCSYIIFVSQMSVTNGQNITQIEYYKNAVCESSVCACLLLK
jgi:hypothetical protein